MRGTAAILLAAVSACCAAPTSPSNGATNDVLEFIIGDSSVWPRQGTQWQHQQVNYDRREVCWIKYGNSQTFECWRWDDDWVYHRVDHGLDGNTGESYEFTDGRWLPRRMAGSWMLDVTDNRIRWFDPFCRVNDARSGAFPYQQRAHLEAAQVISPDLGIREVLVLEYAPRAGAAVGYYETFKFVRDAGWFAWQNTTGGSSRFDRFAPCRRARSRCWRARRRPTPAAVDRPTAGPPRPA